MLAAVLRAKWEPKKEYKPTPRDIVGKKTYLGGLVWRYPELRLETKPEPKIAEDEVLIRVRACGICGSDVHMYESTPDGYIKYPGLTAFPVTLGHEFSGEIAKVGERAFSPEGKRFEIGMAVTSEEMIWCGTCKPCRDGFPNHCRALEELGFDRDGALAEYVAVPARCCWPIGGLIERFGEEAGYEAGALVEPTSVSYNAMFVRAGGLSPGAFVVIFGAGPIGLSAVALAKAAGATKVIVSEISQRRLELAKLVGADELINPLKVDSVESKILELTEHEGADMYIEAAGAFEATWPTIERVIWQGERINAKIVAIGRAVGHVPLWFEVLQVRRAQIYGSQGHSGHGIFPNVVRLMASGKVDLTPIVTQRFKLEKILDAMRLASEKKDEHAKILITPS
jgi:hypothetical protein